MSKKIILAAMVLSVAVACQAATINWFVTSDLASLRGSDGSSYLPYGSFIQLIYIGNDGVFDSADPLLWDTADGLNTSDDPLEAIVDTSTVGEGFMTLTTANYGKFAAADALTTYGVGADYVIRVFDNPTGPTGVGYFSYVSAGTVNGGAGSFEGTIASDAPEADDFGVNQFLDTTIPYGVVPEPTTIALALLGVGALIWRHKRS